MDEPRTNLRRTGAWPWVLAGAAVVALGGYGAYRFWPRGEPAAPAVATAPAPEQAPAQAADESPVDAAGAPALLEKVSSNALVRAWLGEGNPIRRAVVILANVAEGVVPRKLLTPFAPGSPFSVERRGDRTVIGPESYARYDAVGDAADSIDARTFASVYRRLRGVLEPALRELGYPAGSLDVLTLRALKRVEGAPVADGDVAVRNEGGAWVYADPRQEKLGELDKQLLRMGPKNERRLQAKAREVREALKLPAVAAGAR
jgi:hypothetical protein